MAVCSCGAETVVRNQSSWILSLFVVKQGSGGNNLPIYLFVSCGKQGGASFKPVQQFIYKLQPF